jgi:hypothetical protein
VTRTNKTPVKNTTDASADPTAWTPPRAERSRARAIVLVARIRASALENDAALAPRLYTDRGSRARFDAKCAISPARTARVG